MIQWLKTVTATMCILTLLFHLIPEGKFEKYVKFYGGLLFFLVAAGPLLQLFAGEGEMERLLRLEFVKEELDELAISAKGMEELKNDRILEAYRQELMRQVEEIATAYGLKTEELQLTFDEQEPYLLTGIFLRVEENDDAAFEAFREETAGIFAVPVRQIRISRQGAMG